MDTAVDLYRADDFVKLGSIGLIALLSTHFQPILGRSLADADFQLTFLAIGDGTVLDGEPTLVNLHSRFGYVYVRITLGSTVLYQHPHAVREVVGRPLQQMLGDRFPGERHMGFVISSERLGGLTLVRPAPVNELAVAVPPRRRQAPRFHVEEIPEPAPPLATADELGLAEKEWEGDIGVVLTPPVNDGLTETMPLSAEVEEGGFLAGYVFRDAERPERYIVQVSAVIPAERTGASLLHFTFTGDSFILVNEQLARRGRGEFLVGWYHTHLFPATDRLGLSTIDVDLHRSTFRRPWQVAGLVNIDRGRRQLRFYGLERGDIALVPHRIGAR